MWFNSFFGLLLTKKISYSYTAIDLLSLFIVPHSVATTAIIWFTCSFRVGGAAGYAARIHHTVHYLITWTLWRRKLRKKWREIVNWHGGGHFFKKIKKQGANFLIISFLPLSNLISNKCPRFFELLRQENTHIYFKIWWKIITWALSATL